MKKINSKTLFALCLLGVFVICAFVAMIKSCSYDKYAITYMKGDSINGIIINDTVVGKPKLEINKDTYVIKAANKDITSKEPLELKSVQKIDD